MWELDSLSYEELYQGRARVCVSFRSDRHDSARVFFAGPMADRRVLHLPGHEAYLMAELIVKDTAAAPPG